MRIALVALHFAEYAARLAVALAERHEVLLVLRRDNADGELTAVLKDRAARATRLVLVEHRKLRDPRVVCATRSIVREVRTFAPDVVHFQEYVADYAAAAWWRLSRHYPLVLTVHDYVTHSGADSRLPWRKRRYLHAMRRDADHLILHGESLRAEAIRGEGRSPGEVSAIAHGILGVDGVAGESLPPEPASFLFFGRIEVYKGLGVLLDAMARLADLPQLRLSIAGRGDDLVRHRARIAADARITIDERFIGAEEIPALFSRAAAVVMPYLDASQSGVAAIAFACGRPVIASRTGALPEVVHERESGLLVEPGDAEGLAAAMRTMVLDESLRVRLGQGACHQARTVLDWGVVSRATEAAYAVALASGKRAEGVA